MNQKKVVPSRAPTSFVNSGAHLESTFAQCSTYPSSERTCNKELTLFVRVAVVLPLPTKPRALREPYLLEIFAKWVAPYHSPQIANYEQVPIGYLMTMR